MKDAYYEKVDIFTHISPPSYETALYKKAKPNIHKEHNALTPSLVDLDARFRMMDKFEGLKQVLTVTQPPLETVVDAKDAIDLAKLANDEMADLISRFPDKFVTAAACLPMNDVDVAVKEVERATSELNLKGIQLFTPVGGKSLDSPEFMPLFEFMCTSKLPIWIHPTRDQSVPDYANEIESKYDMFRAIGWPYETSKAVARLVYSGILDKFPDLKFIIHHLGAMVPFFENRFCRRDRDWLQKPVEYYYKNCFYGDTAVGGHLPSLICGHMFFGDDHVLFGTDAPYVGQSNIEQVIKSVESLNISETAKQKIFAGNAKKLLGLSKS